MLRPLFAAAFVLAALLPDAIALAQQSGSQNSNSSTKATTSNAQSRNNNNANNNTTHKHKGNNPWWGRSVYINAGNAEQYLTPTSTPKPPAKNNVNTGGQVFKSIGN
ncbi:MAG: hypothetical protein JO241_04860 [Candidatus Eremiobacteraeota bacterium]|nr:hypothetical protein [Candidatus Eremiobacteraeota bacterium]